MGPTPRAVWHRRLPGRGMDPCTVAGAVTDWGIGVVPGRVIAGVARLVAGWLSQGNGRSDGGVRGARPPGRWVSGQREWAERVCGRPAWLTGAARVAGETELFLSVGSPWLSRVSGPLGTSARRRQVNAGHRLSSSARRTRRVLEDGQVRVASVPAPPLDPAGSGSPHPEGQWGRHAENDLSAAKGFLSRTAGVRRGRGEARPGARRGHGAPRR